MPKFREFPLPPGVEQIPGEPLRFLVQSRSGKSPYLVDLEECGFNGACGCKNFQCTHLPLLKEDRREGVRFKRRCWHIKQAIYYLGELTMRLVEARLKLGSPKQEWMGPIEKRKDLNEHSFADS